MAQTASVIAYEERRRAIQRAAVDVIRRKGVRGMTFTEIGAALGLVPSAIGYYYRRKEDLVVSCLLESIAKFDSFTAAAARGIEPSERVRLYFSELLGFWGEVLSGSADPVILFNEVRTIKAPQVDAAYMHMYRNVRRELDLDPPLGRLERNARAHQFLTQVFWVTLWAQRYDPRDFPRLSERISDLLINGLAGAGRSWSPLALPLEPAGLASAPGDAFLKAVELINEEGYRGASVEKIAARLSLTKGAFYHHHEAKDDLVVAGFRRTLATIRAAQDQADSAGRDGLERLCLATAELWRFHSNQEVTEQPDGSVLVSFRASGMLELAWHLFTWADKVEIVAPPRLQALMVTELQSALAAHQANLTRPILA